MNCSVDTGYNCQAVAGGSVCTLNSMDQSASNADDLAT